MQAGGFHYCAIIINTPIAFTNNLRIKQALKAKNYKLLQLPTIILTKTQQIIPILVCKQAK